MFTRASGQRWATTAATVVVLAPAFGAPGASASGVSAADIAAAKPALSEAQAVAEVRRLLSIPADYQLTQESYDENSQQGSGPPAPSYSLTFQYPPPQPRQNIPPTAITLNVTVNAATGLIANFYRDEPRIPRQTFVFPVPLTYRQAQADAMSWAQKLYGSQYPDVRLQPASFGPGETPLTAPVAYTFSFERYENGIPMPSDGFSLTIGEHGELTSANDNWTAGLAFPAPPGAISQAQANGAYRANMALYLGYTQVYGQNGASSVALTYQQYLPPGIPIYWNTQFAGAGGSVGYPVLDALTGKPLASTGAQMAVAPYPAPKPLVPGGPAVFPGTKKANWSRQQAISAAEAIAILPKGAALSDVQVSQSPSPGGDTMYNLTWKAKGYSGQASATVDATIGLLTSFSNFMSPAAQHNPLAYKTGLLHPKFSAEEARAAAAAFVRKVLPDDTGGVAIVPSGPANPGAAPTYFQIVPIVHGIPFVNGAGSVNLNPLDGSVQYYSFDTTVQAVRIPAPSHILPLPRAESEWAKEQPLTLAYLVTQPLQPWQVQKFGTASSAPASSAPRIVLAYMPVGQIYGPTLNALTGQWQNGTGNPPGQPSPYYGPIHDLAGVAAAPEIELLAQHGLLAVDAKGDAHPDRMMTQAEFVNLAVQSLTYPNIFQPLAAAVMRSLGSISAKSPDYQAVEFAYQQGWLQPGEPFDPNSPVTRRFAALFLARELGFASLLAAPGILPLATADASSLSGTERAAAAIAVSLGMLPPVDGKFDASASLTVADAAVAVVKMAVAFSKDGLTVGGGPVRY